MMNNQGTASSNTYTVTIPEFMMNNTNIPTEKYEEIIKKAANKFDPEVKELIEMIKSFYEDALKRNEKTVYVKHNSYVGTETVRTIGLEEVREMLYKEIKKEIEDDHKEEVSKLNAKLRSYKAMLQDIQEQLEAERARTNTKRVKELEDIKASYEVDKAEIKTSLKMEYAAKIKALEAINIDLARVTEENRLLRHEIYSLQGMLNGYKSLANKNNKQKKTKKNNFVKKLFNR